MNKEEQYKIAAIKKEIEGFDNNIWAYKFEFTDIDKVQRDEMIASFEKRKRLAEAKIKAIEIKDKLN